VTNRLPIGQRLVQQGHIDAWQLQSALGHQQRWGGRLGEALVGLGFLPEEVALSEVARQLGVPYLDVANRWVAPEVMRLVPEKLIRRRRVFPIAIAAQTRRGPLVVATAEPQDLAALDDVAFATGMIVKPVLASARAIDRLVARHLDDAAPVRYEGVELPVDHGAPMRVVPFGHEPN
jgi:type IV pilus assembly protein PilB